MEAVDVYVRIESSWRGGTQIVALLDLDAYVVAQQAGGMSAEALRAAFWRVRLQHPAGPGHTVYLLEGCAPSAALFQKDFPTEAEAHACVAKLYAQENESLPWDGEAYDAVPPDLAASAPYDVPECSGYTNVYALVLSHGLGGPPAIRGVQTIWPAS